MTGRLNRIKTYFQFDNYWELLLGRLIFRKTSIKVLRIGTIQAVVDHRGADTASICHCLGTDAYKQFLSQINITGSINVVDMGANVGGFSLLIKHLNIEVKKLLCVEMNPNTFSRLQMNIMTNYGPEAMAVNAAVCAEPTEFQLELGVGSTNDSITRGTMMKSDLQTYEVTGCTFDDLIGDVFAGETIDLCKMDVEGAEYEVLTDPNSEIESLKICRYLLIELHPVEYYAEMIAALSKLKFELVADEGKDRAGVHLFKNKTLA